MASERATYTPPAPRPPAPRAASTTVALLARSRRSVNFIVWRCCARSLSLSSVRVCVRPEPRRPGVSPQGCRQMRCRSQNLATHIHDHGTRAAPPVFPAGRPRYNTVLGS